MFLKKIFQIVLLITIITAPSFVLASAESVVTEKAYSLLKKTEYPWTRDSARKFVHLVNEECGYRGMQHFLNVLSEKFTEADREKIEFSCPVLSFIEVSGIGISDPLGMKMDIAGYASSKSSASVAKSISGKILQKALDKALPYFKAAGGWVYKVAWPAVKSAAKWMANAIGEAAAADYVKQKTCEYTGKWCS